MSKSASSTELLVVAVLFLLVAGLCVYDFAQPWRPPTLSQHGHGIDLVISYLLVATGAIFVVGHLVLVGFVWRGRRQDGRGPGHASPRAQWITALVPVLIMTAVSEVGVLFLGMPVFGQIYGPPPADAFQVELVGKQFSWTVRYPGPDGEYGQTDPKLVDDDENPLGIQRDDPAGADDIVEIGLMRVPANRPVVVRLRSHDVLHSFSVATLRVKQDIVPGTVQRTRFVAEAPGKHEIGCAELCGLGHYRMRGFLEVMEPAAFDGWMSEQTPWTENF